jgi:hypothetical protein
MNIYYVAAIWLGMALLASVISIRIAVPAALVEIVVGALAGNIPGIREHVTQTAVVVFLASVGSLVLTFLAGAEIDPVSLRGHWKASLSIGLVSFTLAFLAAFGFYKLVLGWDLHAAEIGGIALSTTSVVVVYAVRVETGLNRHDLGKLILAACFITDLGTVLLIVSGAAGAGRLDQGINAGGDQQGPADPVRRIAEGAGEAVAQQKTQDGHAGLEQSEGHSHAQAGPGVDTCYPDADRGGEVRQAERQGRPAARQARGNAIYTAEV